MSIYRYGRRTGKGKGHMPRISLSLVIFMVFSFLHSIIYISFDLEPRPGPRQRQSVKL